ncbi:beta-glucosidase [Nocardioides sp. NPDC101246]|uniref:beta-glucosidase family protein n=1 Tax=Nocardioides sp. NPDC101246 TaxID=3364336 RepID=UPI0037F95E1F
MTVETLTLEQKAALLSGGGFWSTAALPEAGVDEVVLTDGPHGVRRQIQGTDHLGIYHSEPATCFPPAVAIGSSWDPSVAERLGAALAAEARALGVGVLLGPGVNIKRSPLGGRNFEYLSEDPLLSGVLGAAYVRALQAGGVGASLKHFAANDQETERMQISADVDERPLREIHLPAFERIVTEASPATVMCSYNLINGVRASEDHRLLTGILREGWGYRGAVVSDWGAVHDAVASLEAGLDLAMPGTGPAHAESVVEAVRSGRLEESVVDRAAERVLALGTYAVETGSVGSGIDVEAHHALARELATESAVLLRNEVKDGAATLPLSNSSSIAVIGAFASEPRYQGGGSSRVNATRVDIPLDAICAHAEAAGGTVTFEPGFTIEGADEASHAAAVATAATADVAVVFAGIPESAESEGFDRDSLDLPPEQVRLIIDVAASAPRTVVVLSNGGVVSLEGWHDDVDAILEGFLLGQGGGQAIADLLFGLANPSGRLSETIPLRLQDTPAYLNFPGEQGHVRYGEGVMVGYRHYTSVEAPVRYSFGHGLSYTTFGVDDLTVTVTGPDSATASVTVANTGDVAGRHVVQLYIATDAGPVRRPARELAAFSKIGLEAGESTTVTLDLDRRSFAYWDIELDRWTVPAGEYRVQVGESSAEVSREQTITLEGDAVEAQISLSSSVAAWLAHPVAGPLLAERMEAFTSGKEEQFAMVRSMPMIQILAFTGGRIDGDWLMGLARGADA